MGSDAAVQQVTDPIAIAFGVREDFGNNREKCCDARQNGRIMLAHVVAVLYGVGNSLVKCVEIDMHLIMRALFFFVC